MRTGEQGQALVEAAFILPAMIFLLLLTIQLTQLQQARIMVEYAAFSAARTGIVQNGNNGGTNGFDGPMHDAAVLAILPTFGRTDSLTNLLAARVRFAAEDAVLRPFGLSQVRESIAMVRAHMPFSPALRIPRPEDLVYAPAVKRATDRQNAPGAR